MRLLATIALCAVFGIAMGRSNLFTDPCKSKTRTSAHENQCDAYYECFDEQPVLQHCPNGLVYHGKRHSGLFGVCDYDFNLDCSDRPERNSAISTEHCDWLYGIFGHETSCTRYWTCWNGTATEQFCIGGLLYNEETHACDWPQNVAGCQKHPLCKDDPNANVPLGKSCERYWACQGGYPRLQRCPATLVFDKQSRRCVSPPTVDCDVPSTTPPPPQEHRPPRRPINPARGANRDSQQPPRNTISAQRPAPQQQPPRNTLSAQRPAPQQQPPRNTLSVQRPPPQRRPPFQQSRPLPVEEQFIPAEEQPQPAENAFRPFIPENAFPLQVGDSQSKFRPPPIPDAIPLN